MIFTRTRALLIVYIGAQIILNLVQTFWFDGPTS